MIKNILKKCCFIKNLALKIKNKYNKYALLLERDKYVSKFKN